MQNDEKDILGALMNLLKTLRETENLASKPLEQWSTYSPTLKKFTNEDNKVLYQSKKVKYFTQVKEHYLTHYEDVCRKVSDCIKSILGWSDLTLMRDIIVVLNTLGWERLIQENSPLHEIDRLVTRFKIPLESAGCTTEEIHKEFQDMIEYVGNFIPLSTMDYSSV